MINAKEEQYNQNEKNEKECKENAKKALHDIVDSVFEQCKDIHRPEAFYRAFSNGVNVSVALFSMNVTCNAEKRGQKNEKKA